MTPQFPQQAWMKRTRSQKPVDHHRNYFDAFTIPSASLDIVNYAFMNINSQRNDAQPAGKREKIDDHSHEVKSRTARDDNDPTNPEASHYDRSTRAENAMSNDAKNRIAKNEGEDGKRYKKALMEGAKVEDTALKTKMKELERLQKVHKQAVKDETAAATSHSKAIKSEHKLDVAYLSARSKHESAFADLKATENAVNVTKRHAAEQTQRLQEKQREVEELRGKKAVEDREREAKIKQLTTSPLKPTSA